MDGYIVITREISQLGLSPAEAMTLGLIFGFSQGQEGIFYGSRTYIAEFVGCSVDTVTRTLRKLEEKGLVEKGECYDGGVRRCTYKATLDRGCKMQGVQNAGGAICGQTGGKMRQGGRNLHAEGGANCMTDNKRDNKYIINNNKADLPFSSQSFIEAWDDLRAQPKWRNKSASALRKALDFLSKYTESEAIEIINRTIIGGWQGLFPLRDREAPQRTSSPVLSSMKAGDEILQRIMKRNAQAIEEKGGEES